MAVTFQTFNHASCPTLTLSVKSNKRFRRAGKTDCRGLKTYPPAAVYERPSKHDVFTDHRRPSVVCFDYLSTKRAKGSLGHESSLIERLLTLGSGDSSEVIPFL